MNVMNLTILGLIYVLDWENCHHVVKILVPRLTF
ncbi:hypothetical protein LINGRAHAP2_LOCUS10841 [Linum grandiflorum]